MESPLSQDEIATMHSSDSKVYVILFILGCYCYFNLFIVALIPTKAAVLGISFFSMNA